MRWHPSFRLREINGLNTQIHLSAELGVVGSQQLGVDIGEFTQTQSDALVMKSV